ncbi:TMEM43 family protein [Devosia sp. FKR38]|uniref:TMEM43 family protein n=1 Tax=Devosia sp. FKR38 TaxID=2562312 RepID=UPI0010C01931|nr:TMEM43 family protein [Devosia sp. FKR38]
MSDSFTTTTHQSWFSRIGNSFAGVLIGLALIVGMIVLLFWSEGRAVQTEKALAEGAGAVVLVDNAPVDPANEGRLIHVTGPVVTGQVLTDDAFGIAAEGIRLVRTVEMYQWVESESSEKKTTLGGGEETFTTYTYTKAWKEGRVNSAEFKQPNNHQNPQAALESQTFQIDDGTLGDFALTESVLDQVGGAKDYPIKNAELDAITEANTLGVPVALIDGSIVTGANPASPRVGDLKIAYQLVPLGDISVIAQQSGDSFAPYQTQAGDALQLVDNGVVAAPAMFKAAADENNLITWIIRSVGLLLLITGFALVTGPLSVIASVVPFLGSIVGFGTGIIAWIMGLSVGTLTIAIAWFFYRPLLSLIIIAVGAALVFGVIQLGKARAKGKAAAAA